MGIAVMLTRFIPFALFQGRQTPRFVRYLGGMLPAAVFGMLVVYCLKDVSFASGHYGLPEIIAIIITIAIHVWRRQMLWSIAAGTIAYMALVQTVFL